MSSIARQKKIIQYINKHKGLSVHHLSKLLKVSLNTIRSDIKLVIEHNPDIKKTHGGIILATEPQIDIRYKHSIAEKKRIGQIISKHLLEYKAPILFIDSSTTTYICMKTFISTQRKATFITNTIDILPETKCNPNISAIGCGGLWWAAEHCFIGDQAERELSQYHTDIAIISTSGLTKKGGLFNGNMETVKIKQIMSKQSKETWIVAESGKFDKSALIKFLDFSSITKIFTEKKLPPEWELFLQNKGIQYFY